MKRFLLREEYFGGLLYDREKKKKHVINRWQTKALQLIGHVERNHLISILQTENLVAKNYDNKMDDDITRKMNEGKPNNTDLIKFLEEEEKREVIVDQKLNADVFQIEKKLRYPMLSAPMGVFIEITNLCNMGCVHCYNVDDRIKEGYDKKCLTTEQILDFLDQCQSMGAFYVKIQGGEPVLQRDWERICRKSFECGMATTLYTGGYFRGKENVLAKISEMPFDEIRLTFAGLDEIHDNARPVKPVISGKGQPTYREVQKTLDYLLNKGANIKLNFLLTRNNMHQVEDFVKLMAQKSINYQKPFDINFGPQRPFGEGFRCPGDIKGENILKAEDFYQVNQKIEELRNNKLIQEAGMHLIVVFDMLAKSKGKNLMPRDLRKDGCSQGKQGVSIAYDGRVGICGFMLSAEILDKVIKLDNILDIDNIKEKKLIDIWHDSKILDKSRQYEKMQCVGCEYYLDTCQGICPAMAYYTTGDWTKGDPGCFKSFARGLGETLS